MARRAVHKTGKGANNDITALCDDGAPWSPRSKADAIRDIDNNVHTYYVPWRDKETEIRVVPGSNGRYLRTDRDSTNKNNLEELPNC